MPYKRRYNRNRRYRKNKSLAVKAYQLAKKAYKMPELKHTAITVADTTPDSTGSIEELSVNSAGTSNNGRIGDTILPTSVHMRGRLIKNASATSTQVRIMVFRWISEAPSALSDVLVSATVQSFKSENTRFQSEILYDRVITLDSASKDSVFINKRIKLKKPISYAQGSSAANRNGIWILLLSNEAANTPTLGMETRLFYRDP